MRLMIAGGGGFRVPLVYRALSSGPFAGLVRELVLYDVDAGRLAAVDAVLASLAGQSTDAGFPTVRATTSLAEALDGTDMVFAAIRPGGTAGRTADERIALDLGLLGQETTGAGGISYALRSIPRMLELAAEMRRRCPEAWLLNFTNPAGIVTEALVPVLGHRVVGICDSASGLVHRAARAAGVALPEGRLQGKLDGILDGVGYYGLNHLGWLYRLESGGRDVLPELLADAAALAGFEEGRLFGQEFLAGLGCLPNEYLYYYYDTVRAVAGIRASAQTRGESIDRQQSALYPRLAAAGPEAYPLWEAARRSREEGYLAEARTAGERRDESDLDGGGYERVALAAMRALSGGGEAELILNTPNTVPGAGPGLVPAVPGLPADAVVEVPCRVSPDGVVPLPQDRPAPAQLALMRRVKDVERLVVQAAGLSAGQAAGQGRRQAALAAFARHPLVDSEVLAGQLLAGYEAAFPELALLWRGGDGPAPGHDAGFPRV
ncbi:6-phospho-beta-glucosidase [Arthrobacter sp. PAMC25564]|uniref:family 4 glycosyl hydrolase n=1 Tax=Arthrobacter sp. PAMC25564 TaxID=2565366 RepID=UPI0010A239A1|nr:6-phospho-beta-glucosidase [Arthrobacter sp. PAMC25564]QCB96775.1 6-phospho-beta-glucosidase [Arthrobacter sp. PAMC25564]